MNSYVASWSVFSELTSFACRATGTTLAGQAKTGPLINQATLVMVINIKIATVNRWV